MDHKENRKVYWTNVHYKGERHYLHLLLHHVKGATCFTDLKTSPDRVLHRTFKEMAPALGLLETDEEWDDCLSEASVSFMPKQLCSLFVTILIFGEPSKPHVLWEKYKEVLGEDLAREVLRSSQRVVDLHKQVENEVLLLIQEELEGMGSCLEDYGLPTPNKENRIKRIPEVIQDEMFDVNIQKSIAETKCQNLNIDQEQAFSIVMKAVQDETQSQRMFFLNAPGGYGKISY